MLEALDPFTLRTNLGIMDDGNGRPAVGSVASAARACINSWRSPARARVTAYLHRQLMVAGFDEESVRNCVADVVDALIDIGDVCGVRLDGKASLVSSRRSWIHIADGTFAMLGNATGAPPIEQRPRRFARIVSSVPSAANPVSFPDWLGPAGFRVHLARRLGGQADGTIREFFSTLSSVVRHEGNPLDPTLLRAVVDPPGTHQGFFGRHSLPEPSGRWSTMVPDGTWCGVRPGRNPNEWHPIFAAVEHNKVQALDLFDWDEWNWALLSRGIALGAPERSGWINGVHAFEHPIPTQFVRALRLIGGPGVRAWTWCTDEAASKCFDAWRRAEL